NPTTGEVLWKHSEDEGPRGQNAARSGAGRGVAYWSNANGSDQRIIYVRSESHDGRSPLETQRRRRATRPERRAQRRRTRRRVLVKRQRIGPANHLRHTGVPDDRPGRKDRRTDFD